MTISLQDETVIVTGGAVRLGRAIALACADAGANVAITYNQSQAAAQDTLEELQTRHPHRTFAAFPADVSLAADVERLAREVTNTFGRVTALVNNAAIFRRTPFAEMTEADFDSHINANLKGPYLLCRQFGELFLKQGRGAIVNIADIYGLKPLKNYVPYCVSKAGVVMLTEALALALAPTIRVNCLCPGTILPPSETQGEGDEEALLKRRIPCGRLGTPEEIAATVVFLLGGPEFITGVVLPMDGAQRLK